MPVPVDDVIETRALVGQMIKAVADGMGSEDDMRILTQLLEGANTEPSPQTRAEVLACLERLHARLGEPLTD